MKKILFISIAVLLGFFYGCKPAEGNEPTVEDEYYIKYVAYYSASAVTYARAYVNAPDGQKTFDMMQTTEEYTYGPVKAGFEMKGVVSVYTERSTQPKKARIDLYVSKNGNPFVMVATDSKSVDDVKGVGVDASYTIE